MKDIIYGCTLSYMKGIVYEISFKKFPMHQMHQYEYLHMYI